MTPQEIQAALEAIIYAADEPATIDQIAARSASRRRRHGLRSICSSRRIRPRIAESKCAKWRGGWKFYTKPQHHDVVRKFIKSLQPPHSPDDARARDSRVIAYKQPATVPEINEIRGVNVGGVIKTLLEKRLITTAGRKAVIGRPILYRTSKQFLMRFGLSDLEELPSLKEFEQFAQAALGSDEGVAPTEPDDAAQTGGEVMIPPELSADARETMVEAESIDASGEQSAEAEIAPSPAESAAEVFADSDESASDPQAKGTSA